MKNVKRILLIIGIVLAMFGSYIFGVNSASDLNDYSIGNESSTDGDIAKLMDKQTEKTLNEIVNTIQENYYKDITDDELNEGILRGVVESLGDPYSVYMNQEEYKKFMESSDGEYVGVGLVVSPGKDGYITVVSPVKGSPAEKAGIKTDDKILKVNGQEYSADKMSDAVSVMRGKEGEKVTLTIGRNEKNGFVEKDYEIIRKKIKLETVFGEMLEDKIGYIGITEFDKPTYTDFVAQYKKLKKDGMKSLILDLRGNPGGLLDVCADLADFFLDEGTIVYTKYKDGEKDYYYSDAQKEDIPMVVLVNGGSASASEIVSGALQDRGRAKIIGTQTFGKGIVQRIFDLNSGQALKVTVSEYFTPNDKNIHGIGIEPDIIVELDEDVEGIGTEYLDEDLQLQKAIEVLKKGNK